MENGGENTFSYLRRWADRHISTHGSFCTTYRLAHKCDRECEKTLKLNQNKQQPYSHTSLQQDVLSKTNTLVSPWSVHLFTLVALQNRTARTSPPLVTKTQKHITPNALALISLHADLICSPCQRSSRSKRCPSDCGGFGFSNVKSMEAAQTCRLTSSSLSFTLRSDYLVTCHFEHILAQE